MANLIATPQTKLLSVTQVANRLNVAPITIRRNLNKMPHHRIGDRILFTEEDIQAFLEACAVSVKGAENE